MHLKFYNLQGRFFTLVVLLVTTLTLQAQLHYEGLIYDGLGKPLLDNVSALSMSPDGKHVYAISFDDNAVNVYERSETDASLIFIETKRTGIDDVTDIDGPYGLSVSPDGNHLYIASALSNSIIVFNRNVNSGTLTFVESLTDNENGVDGLEGCFNLVLSPDGNHLYATGPDENAVAVFNRNVVTGKLTFTQMMQDESGMVNNMNYPLGLSLSKDGQNLYVTSYGDNAVNVFARNSFNGLLTFVSDVGYNATGPNEIGGTFAIETSHDGKNVYVTGSESDGVAIFDRNQNDGNLTYIGGVVDNMNGVDGIDYPVAIRISKDDNSVYVAGANEDAIALFTRDETTGMLSFSEMQQDGSTPGQTMEYPIGFVLSPEDDHFYTASFYSNAIVHFQRNLTDGKLTYATVADGSGIGVDGLSGANAALVSQDGNFVYVAGYNDDAIAVFERDEMSGVLTPSSMVADQPSLNLGLNGVNDMAVSPDGSYLYATAFWNASVSVFNVNISTGELTFVESIVDEVNGISELNGANSVEVSPDGNHVYVTSFWDQSLTVFARNMTDGTLTMVQELKDGTGGVNGLGRAASVVVSPNGMNVYTAANFDDGIGMFTRDLSTGMLTYIDLMKDGVDGVEGLDGVNDLVINPAGDRLYSVSSGDNALSVFVLDPSSGALTFETMMTNGMNAEGLDGAQSVNMSNDGTFLYTTSDVDDAISVFRVNAANATLDYQKTQYDNTDGVDGLAGAQAVAVSPSGRHMYVTGASDDAVSYFSCTYNTNLTQVICQGDSVIVGSSIYQTTGTYKDTFSIGSCNSIISLDLIVHLSVTEMDVEICEGDAFMFGGIERTVAGTYTENKTSYIGCDSTIQLNLAVISSFDNEMEVATICQGESYSFGSNVYYNDGTYSEELSSSFGCDSTISLDLTVLTKEDIFLNEFICPGEFYVLGNSNFISSGIYSETFTAANGCDSTITVDLVVLNNAQTVLTKTVCEGSSYELNGNVYSTTGTYVQQITTQGGCQSEVTLDLTVLQNSETPIIAGVCTGETYEIAGNIYTQTGMYEIDLISASGCDSTILLDFTVSEVMELEATVGEDIGTSDGSIDLTVSGGMEPYTYSWSNGESTQDLDNLEEGTYTVIVTDANDCTSTESFDVAFVVGLNEVLKLDVDVTAYPNPISTNTNLNVVINSKEFLDAEIMLFDITGKLMSTQTIKISEGESKITIQSPTVQGLYFVQLATAKGIVQTLKVTVQ